MDSMSRSFHDSSQLLDEVLTNLQQDISDFSLSTINDYSDTRPLIKPEKVTYILHSFKTNLNLETRTRRSVDSPDLCPAFERRRKSTSNKEDERRTQKSGALIGQRVPTVSEIVV